MKTEGGEILPCEPGHMGLSPATELELEIFSLLLPEWGEVYAELLLSGPGLLRLHKVLAAIADSPETASTPAEVIEQAEAGDELAAGTAYTFCNFLGSVCGDFAVSTGALGGVYLAGGIAPRMLPILEKSEFLERMCNKNAQGENLRCLPVQVITHSQPGLLGASYAPL